MDWIVGLQKAIDYIEENLQQPLDMNTIVTQANCSSFYFQRLFSLLTGLTLGEYIRKRRLSEAAHDLRATDARIIDIALNYGYDTPESFSRAFKTYHGCSPSEARKETAPLKNFSRIKPRLTIDGGTDMDYRIVKLDSFKVLEKVKTFTTKDGLNFKEIPRFWSEAWADGTSETLCRYEKTDGKLGPLLLGICYSSKTSEFDYSIAVECDDSTTAPEGFRVNTIAPQTWIVLKAIGPLPDAIQSLWKRSYSEIFPSSEYQPTGKIDFEAYPDNSGKDPDKQENELWIAVEKK